MPRIKNRVSESQTNGTVLTITFILKVHYVSESVEPVMDYRLNSTRFQSVNVTTINATGLILAPVNVQDKKNTQKFDKMAPVLLPPTKITHTNKCYSSDH